MDKKPILVVDDEKNIRMTVAQSLETLEIPVETAVNGEEALQKLRQRPFRVVFLDLRMPGVELVGKVVQYEDMYRLCYIRGPEGIIIGLAQELG